MRKVAQELSTIAKLLIADMSLPLMKEDLDDLDTLSQNIDRAVEDFGYHFRIASLDPQITSQFDILKKAKEGLQHAKTIQESVKRVLSGSPEDKTAQRVALDAEIMVGRFQRHIQDAQKVIMTISRKAMPPALKQYAAAIAREIRARLEDPDVLQVIPWQDESYDSGVHMVGLRYQVVFRINLGDTYNGIKEINGTAMESTVSKTGPTFENKLMSPREATEVFLAGARGWAGWKGESSAISKRESIAEMIGAVLVNFCGQMGQSTGGRNYKW